MPSIPSQRNPRPRVAGAVCVLLVFVSSAGALKATEAQAILQEAFRRTMSRAIRFEGALVRYDPNDRATQRSRWRFERSGPPGEGSVKITFLEPQDLRGVMLLIRSTPERPPEQWLYTPATDRARRVRPETRGRRFYSTDFAFDDLQEADAGLQSYRLTGRQEAVGEECWRIEAQTGAQSPYDQKVFFISVDKGVIVQTDHFLDSSRVKRIIYRNYRNLDGAWLPGQIDAFDIETGSHTVLVVEESQIDVAFSESAFEPESLGSP